MTESALALRKRLRDARRRISNETQSVHANEVCLYLLNSTIFENNSCTAVYLSNDGELDLAPVVGNLHAKDIKVAVPRISSREMNFVQLTKDASLETNKWQICEPKNTPNIGCEEIDVVLMPLVAFTSSGDRLGRGGGYYDRYFANCDAIRIGIAHELQKVDSLDPKPWDLKLDAVVTEVGWHLCSSRAVHEIKLKRSFSA